MAIRNIGSLLAAVLLSASAQAADGKLLLTGGVSSIEGAAGGGLTPWAVTGSYASQGELGGSLFATRVDTQDYALTSYGALFAWGERLELALARQDFDTGRTGAALGLPGLRLKQDIAGLKWHFCGDAVLDADNWLPQLALGAEFKRSRAGGLAPTLASLGAGKGGTDVYLSATKLLLAQGVLLNLTLRATKANQNGLLGFGGAASDRYNLHPEVSIAYLLSRHWVVGAEYRSKPDQLNPSALGAGLREQDWKDVFVAWAPSKRISLTAAYVDLGAIVPAVVSKRQTGAYLSAQLAF
jgi:Protein of unknown function (DUF3034)